MAILLLALALAAPLRARGAEQPPEPPPEPPPEAGDGDYTLETPDSLADQELEVAVGAASRGGSELRRSQRVSFRGGGTSATLRDGDDPLSGGRVEAAFAAGTVSAGRLSPRWGRGLVLGGAGAPWVFSAEDRGAGAPYRGRSGTGLGYENEHVALLGGRFARHTLLGARAAAGAGSLGVLASGRAAQASAALDGEDRSLELALDPLGRWRAEGAAASAIGETRVALRVRGGHTAFRSLAEPARSGPSRALAASASRDLAFGTVRGFGALWAWRAGQPGARAALEVDAPLGQHASFASGVEEQHGARREPSPLARATGTRQGWWCEWRGGPPGARLTLRHELWGARAFARDAVRRAVVARADWAAPFGGRLDITHAVWRVRSGESLYLPEAGADRLVLRASSGTGSRTRCELSLPVASGRIRTSVTLATGTRGRRPAWTVEWSRRALIAPRSRAANARTEHEVRGADGPDHELGIVRHAGARQGARGEGPEYRPAGDR